MSELQQIFWDSTCAEALGDHALLAGMCRFEGALARASAEAGALDPALAAIIGDFCDTLADAGSGPDSGELACAARHAGALAIPFVQWLTREVAEHDENAAKWVHFGATSQDVQDSALALCLRPATARLDALVVAAGDACAALAAAHATTALNGRTLLQPALPVPFGWKAAVWLGGLQRSLTSWREAARAARLLQFGGASGTLSSFGARGPAIAAALGRTLDLTVPALPWHALRDPLARLGAETAILCGLAGKIARDLSLLMQPEIGEAFEPEAAGRGGSSSMPHKRNPVACMLALEAAQRAPALAATLLAQLGGEHERGLGQWQSQWLTLRDLLASCAGAFAALGPTLAGLQVKPEAMRANLDRLGGLPFSERLSVALTPALGKSAAHALTQTLCARAVATGRTLQDVAGEDVAVEAVLDATTLAALFDPAAAFGAAPEMIRAALDDWRRAGATSL